METGDDDIKLDFDGYNYYYRVINCSDKQAEQKYPLILISGAFQDMNSWKRYVNAFRNEYKIILLDLPGTGKSDLLPERFGLEFLTGALAHFVMSLGVEKVEMVAVSYATPIGYAFAKEYPEKVSHLVLCGTMREIPDNMREATAHAIQMLNGNKMHEFAIEVLDVLTNREIPERIANFYLVERILYRGLATMSDELKERFVENTSRLLRHDPLDISTKSYTRTLVMTGEYDIYTRPEYCREIAASIVNSVFLTIRSADHLFHLEQFAATEQVIRRFLQDQPLEKIPEINEINYF